MTIVKQNHFGELHIIPVHVQEHCGVFQNNSSVSTFAFYYNWSNKCMAF